MRTKLPITLAALFATALLSGCGNSPPGDGFTNGPSPAVLRAEDNPAMRTDLQQPDNSANPSPAGNAAATPAAGDAPKADSKAATPGQP